MCYNFYIIDSTEDFIMNITLLGCGRWGSFIGWYPDKIGYKVKIWGLADAPQFIELKTTRKNNMLSFRESIEFTDNLEEAIASAEVMIISISSQALRSFMERLSKLDLKGKTIVLCMKGIEVATGKRLTEIVSEFITNETKLAIGLVPDTLRILAMVFLTVWLLTQMMMRLRIFLLMNFQVSLFVFMLVKT